MEEDNEDVQLLKSPEEIYSSADTTQKLSYFYNSNRIVSSNTPVQQFFKLFNHYPADAQQNILKEILAALRVVSTNSYLLNEQTKGKIRPNI